ncbi:unnamed protein product [Ixodes pacificus]
MPYHFHTDLPQFLIKQNPSHPRYTDGTLKHSSPPLDKMKKAPSISLAVLFLLCAKIVKSLTGGMQPHLLQCTTRWPEGEERRKRECSLTFTHLLICPWYNLRQGRRI